MSSTTHTNGSARPNMNGSATARSTTQDELLQLNLELKNLRKEAAYAKFHGDELIGDKYAPKGFVARLKNSTDDFQKVLTAKNMPTIMKILGEAITFQGVNMKAAAPLVASMSNDSDRRRALLESQVKAKYNNMLHPPQTYLGDAFQYRTADGKFNNVMSPHLGQAGAPYAKTVPSKTHQIGALPDPGDLFDRLMAREEKRASPSGLSSMLIYHATIIIHDIFRTNDNDKNISDSSSYLDLSPLYGYTMDMQKKIRDDKYKVGLLKPDTFAEDRLLRQPPGVCIMLVMYNRYHNYAARQLARINENGRFTVPRKYQGTMLEAVARYFHGKQVDEELNNACEKYNKAWKDFMAWEYAIDAKLGEEIQQIRRELEEEKKLKTMEAIKEKKDPRIVREELEKEKRKRLDQAIAKANEVKSTAEHKELKNWEQALEKYIPNDESTRAARTVFEAGYRAAWDKLDDDLFNTARLITCGMYIQVAIHDYLRALMGFHQWNTNFTLDPRLDIDHHNVSRGIGNQVTVEFNLLYRFHCAISAHDEEYTKKFMTENLGIADPDELSLEQFVKTMKAAAEDQKTRLDKEEPWEIGFGIHNVPGSGFVRNPLTGLFNDQDMIDALTKAMDDPISNFGPRKVPKCLKPVEIMGIMQARKWEIGTLNDFRDFFGMTRHQTFESVTKNVEIQNALRDLYEHPDKIELYPGVFCESDEKMGMDPGPSDVDSALWSAIFSDAITLVRSDRFYTTDWNTNSLTSWGMKEVTPDDETCKSSVFHRLLQRAFPEWYPYNSVQFFHPFYTRQTNARFAAQQGYAPEFRMSQAPTEFDTFGTPTFDISRSVPQKPSKPVLLAEATKISAVLKDTTNFVHPAFKDPANFPDSFHRMLRLHASETKPNLHPITENSKAMSVYFTNLMRYIIKRESISMTKSTLQIDATRDFAIPVVTNCVSDFLGIGHLIRSAKHPKAPHSENEIYQHITNCQIFLSYNADETKLLKRRKAFKKSMEVLHSLVLGGNIREANRWSASKYMFGTPNNNPMTKLGFEVAERVLSHVDYNATTAAAIMVFVGLHTAFNSVLAFTSALNELLREMYDFANRHNDPQKQTIDLPIWLKVQELAFKNDEKSEKDLQQLVKDAERKSIKLPLIRVALQDKLEVEKDRTVILDVFKANAAVYEAAQKTKTDPKESDFLHHMSSATDRFADFHPKHLSDVGITAMIKVFAQMRNARRGHDAQGRLKKVRLDASAEGYTNYMAPMRFAGIKKAVDMFGDSKHAAPILTGGNLRPETDTYLTAEWDEMVPFPNTWKIRFDGFGKSDYSADVNGVKYPFGKLRKPEIDDDATPYYQPRGASHTGGTFAEVACLCGAHDVSGTAQKAEDKDGAAPLATKTPAEREPTFSSGCGIGH